MSSPSWLDTGDNAWQLTAGSLVGLQSIPGLVVLYAGIVKRKWAINSAFMAFYAFAAVLICWVVWAYKMAFGEQWGAAPFVGTPGPILSMNDELKQTLLPTSGLTANFPMSTMVYFQFVFAAITLVILAGAFLGRMNFTAWMIFVPLWLTFSYTVGAFSLWGGGFLASRGVIDYSGGYVIHVSAGTAGFVGAAWIGPRLQKDREDFQPNNVLLTLVGAGILWTGWNGFNGGDPYAASADAGAAVLNTNIATAMSLLVWTILDIIYFKKPAVIGAVQGMITGLVAITPAAGVVAGWGAIIIGVLSGSIPWVSMNIIGKKVWLFQYVDDTLGVYHTHTVAGIVGGMMVGVFATSQGSAAFGLTNPGGAIDGNWKQVWLQLVGWLFIVGLNIFMTSVIMAFIKYVLRIPLRMSEEQLLSGDDAVHGEDAYAFGDVRRSILHGDTQRVPISGDGEIGVIHGMAQDNGARDHDESGRTKTESEGSEENK
ncbi:ammonium transporter AmtB-like domain-containing protein [Lipomyces mesembrius]